MSYILIVSWLVSTAFYEQSGTTMVKQSTAVTMQEFSSVESCQFASLQAAKIAPAIHMVCVPKGKP